MLCVEGLSSGDVPLVARLICLFSLLPTFFPFFSFCCCCLVFWRQGLALLLTIEPQAGFLLVRSFLCLPSESWNYRQTPPRPCVFNLCTGYRLSEFGWMCHPTQRHFVSRILCVRIAGCVCCMYLHCLGAVSYSVPVWGCSVLAVGLLGPLCINMQRPQESGCKGFLTDLRSRDNL